MVNKQLILLLLLFGCVESHQFTKKNFYSKELKINGYYYTTGVGNETDYVDIYFLYSNGVIYKGGSGSFIKGTKMPDIKLLNSFLYKNNYSNSRTNWGVFKVSGNEISFEMRYLRADAPVYRSSGMILNDSTFVIKNISKPDGEESKEKNSVFHFQYHSPKPDSTNNFIK